MSSADITDAESSSVQHTGGRPRLLLTLTAACTAAMAANTYLAAPLLPLIAREFGTTASGVAWIASIAQLGYAVGLLFFAPLGDSASPRRLVSVLTVLTAAALVASSLAPNSAFLGATMFIAAAATVVPQLLVPLVSERAPSHHRARHVAVLIAGLFTGMVAARVVGGLIGETAGWRWAFGGSAALTLVLGLTTALVLPTRPRQRSSGLFAGIAAIPGLLRRSPDLWRACLRQAGIFGAWSALWTSLSLLLTGPSYGLSAATAGLFGLFGLAASIVAPLSGSLVDRFGATRVIRTAYLVGGLTIPLFWLGNHVMLAVCIASITIHAALVSSHVANQTRALTSTSTPAAANSAYIVSSFAGAGLASTVAGSAFGQWGWSGVCAVAAIMLAIGWGATSIRRSPTNEQHGDHAPTR